MMSDLLAARTQMSMSLGFHIIFAIIGIAMPALMVAAEGLYLRHGDPLDLELARRWSKGTAIMFAVGAVSGTVLSFELGLLLALRPLHLVRLLGGVLLALGRHVDAWRLLSSDALVCFRGSLWCGLRFRRSQPERVASALQALQARGLLSLLLRFALRGAAL